MQGSQPCLAETAFLLMSHSLLVERGLFYFWNLTCSAHRHRLGLGLQDDLSLFWAFWTLKLEFSVSSKTAAAISSVGSLARKGSSGPRLDLRCALHLWLILAIRPSVSPSYLVCSSSSLLWLVFLLGVHEACASPSSTATVAIFLVTASRVILAIRLTDTRIAVIRCCALGA
jgi:hypothetical protein